MLEDNWELNGPHHLLLPGSKSVFFQSKQEEAPWLEVSLEKEAFLSGLLLLCPDDAPPVEASLLSQDQPGSGGSQLEAFKSYTVVCCPQANSMRENLSSSQAEEEGRRSSSPLGFPAPA